MNPMIKYRGGKSKEIVLFEKYIPKDYETYYEPFFGGGALFFYLQPQNAVVSDINYKLIEFYTQIREKYEEARIQLDYIQRIYEENQNKYSKNKLLHPEKRIVNKNEELYYNIRDMFNGIVKPEYLDCVIYFFINKTAYSGMIRYNKKGEYNVPFGRYKNFNTKLITQQHIDLLKNTTILRQDYEESFSTANHEDFIFLDPPYDCVFNDYGNLEKQNGFGEREHIKLAEDFKNLSCKAMMIIGETEFTKGLYKEYIVDSYFKSYSVNIRNRFKSESKHLIITNY